MKRSLRNVLIFFFVTMYALTSCIKDEDTNVESNTWTLESFGTIGDEQPVLQNTEILLELDTNKILGIACNHYSGTYEADDGTIVLKLIAMTEMACITPEGVMEQEANYAEALASVSSYEIVQERLRLYYDDGKSIKLLDQIYVLTDD